MYIFGRISLDQNNFKIKLIFKFLIDSVIFQHYYYFMETSNNVKRK